jgi:hypothetical protein
MLQDVAGLHLEALKVRPNRVFKQRVRKGFIKWLKQERGTIVMAATDDNRRIVGYPFGAPVGYAWVNRDLFSRCSLESHEARTIQNLVLSINPDSSDKNPDGSFGECSNTIESPQTLNIPCVRSVRPHPNGRE